MREATMNAILCGDFETDNAILNQGTWHKFKESIKTRKVYLFGAGKGCREFLDVYGKKIRITGIIDNSPKQIGQKISGIPIFDKSIITDFSDEHEAILITSASYMNDIAEGIERFGFKNYYAYAVLESKRLRWNLFQKIASIYIWKCHRVKKNKILVWNQMPSGGYSCHVKYIVQELIDEKVPCEIVWITNHSEDGFPKEVRLVKNTPLNLMIEHATSRIWIDSFKKDKWMIKKKNQYYINTWHGCVALKKLDFDTPISSKTHLLRTIKDSDMIDLRISNSDFCTNMYRNAMRYQNEVLECGSPRLDKVAEGCKEVYSALGIPEGSSLVMYAPTWRSVTASGEITKDSEFKLDFTELRGALKKKFGGDWYVLVRPHPLAGIRGDYSGDSKVIDVSKYEDVYELLSETKVLISDYSSLIFEAGFFHKPVFIVAQDYEQYKEQHGTYFELDKLPYPLAYSFSELRENIINFDDDDYKKRLDEFHKEINLKETGKASKLVVERIKEILNT